MQNVKSYRFFGGGFFGFPKHTITIGILAHQKKHFEGSLSGPSRGQYLVQVERVFKNANLDQIMTPFVLFFTKCAETPIFIVFFDKPC